MVKIDDQEFIEKFDEGKILASIRMLPDQMEQAWNEVHEIDLPKSYFSISNVVICGMGGSALGGRIIDSLSFDRVRVPIEIFNQYSLPYYVNEKSLVLINSYSGNTEEAISMYEDAKKKRAHIFGIASGGKLKELFESEDTPSYIFDPRANPSNQPRMGLGYSIVSTIAFLTKGGFFHLSDDEFYRLIVTSRAMIKEFDIDIPSSKNIAKSIAEQIHGHALVLISSNHLSGVTHAMKNQINENSKTFSTKFELPELNHHLMEGLRFPTSLHGVLMFLMIHSDLYPKQIEKRYEITKDIIMQNKHKVITYTPRMSDKLSQIVEVLILGSFVSFYLSILNDVNPSEIPFVDYFKEQMKKH